MVRRTATAHQDNTGATLTPPQAGRHLPRPALRRLVRESWFGALCGVILVYVFFAIIARNSDFNSISSASGWLDNASDLGIIAIPVALLAISGEFDLSVGSVFAASELVVAISNNIYHVSAIYSALLALCFGLGIGLINGFVVTRSRIPSFIVTLAMQFILEGVTLGVAYAIAGTTTVSVPHPGWVAHIFAGKIGAFYVSVIWVLGVALLCGWILHRTAWGNWIYATGGDAVTAESAGVPVRRVKILLYAGTGVAAALVGVIQAFEFNEGDGTAGQSYVFLALVAAVLGGVRLAGGYGSVLGVCFGALIYGIVDIGIFYTGWNTNYAIAVVGALLLLAALGNELLRKVKE